MDALIKPLIIGFAKDLQHKGKSQATLESYCRDADNFLSYLEKLKLKLESTEIQTLIDYQEYLMESCADKENSVRRKTIAIRQFFRFLVEKNKITHSPFDQSPIPRRNDLVKSPLKQEDIDALIEVTKNNNYCIKVYRNSS